MNKRAQAILAEVTAQAHIARAKYHERQNEKRRKLARIALKAFAEASRTEKEPLIDNVTDLVCDLRHLCAKKGIDWKRIEFRVNEHTSAEGLTEEPSKGTWAIFRMDGRKISSGFTRDEAVTEARKLNDDTGPFSYFIRDESEVQS